MTWTPTISTSDSYLVYARWTAHHNRATDATYTIFHQGGSTQVQVDQQAQGGEWVLLGMYPLDPASNHRIELTDQATGTVIADAVYVVSASATPNQVTWTPTLTATEPVDVYATWVEGADRSEAVSYTVHHSGGSTPVTVNQRANGGVWNYLGRFTMTPSSNHRVEVTDSTSGTVAADAVRLVSVTTSGAGLMYVHSDHLGTPQKMTDGNQALVWDAVFEPFGEVHSITGTASNNQRFPGQYLDSESAFHYNYFRDYDSSTGRYIQSDPSGLDGGLNTFGYALANPMIFTDFFGLVVLQCQRPADFPFPFNLVDHHWLKTDTREAGMGTQPGQIPGQNQNSDSPGSRVQVVDHSGQSEASNSSCQVVPNIDEDCVNKALTSGRDLGRWTVGNQCQSFVSDIIKECGLPPLRIDGSRATP